MNTRQYKIWKVKFKSESRIVELPEFTIEINHDAAVTAEQYFAAMNKTIAAGIWNTELSQMIEPFRYLSWINSPST